MQSFSIPIDDVVTLLNLERDPRANRNRSSYNVKCPFCGDKKYHMNISTTKNAYRCLLCSPAGEKNLGVLDLYARVRFGERLIPNINSKKLYYQLVTELENDNPYGNIYKNSTPKTEIIEILPANDDVEYPDYEEGIYLFLINQLKFSYGGAIGVLANIYAEASDFSPMSIEIGNNEGFGICQWSGDRKISLYKFASDNGYDIRTLETQLLFLKYELDLNPYYTNMIEILRSCDNSPEGAAYAAQVWCSTFEMPANIYYQCDRRSAIASNILFERHL